MDIKQLRIGAHVEVNGVRRAVFGLGCGRVSYLPHPTSSVALSVFANEVNPIPITPELLAELGFERGSDERKWHKEIDQTWIGIHLFLDRERMRVYVCDDSVDYGNMIVRYLHELENFIYLTLGKELIEE